MAKKTERSSQKKIDNIRALWADKTPENAKVVEIDWVDISQYDNWNTDEDLALATFTSLGYLLYEGPDPRTGVEITVTALTYEPKTKRWADYLLFPTPVIQEMREIG